MNDQTESWVRFLRRIADKLEAGDATLGATCVDNELRDVTPYGSAYRYVEATGKQTITVTWVDHEMTVETDAS